MTGCLGAASSVVHWQTPARCRFPGWDMTIAEREHREAGKTARATDAAAPISPGKRALTDAYSGGMMSTGDVAGQIQAERDARQPTGNVKLRAPKPTDISAILAAGKVPEAKLKDSIAL